MPRPILTLKQPPPEVGDVWKFVSASRNELVQILSVHQEMILIVALQPVTEPLTASIEAPRRVDPSRFNGKKGGYRLHQKKGQQPL